MKKETVTDETIRFSKEKILQSVTYQDRKDLVSALLQDGMEYSLEEVDALIDTFMKRKVV